MAAIRTGRVSCELDIVQHARRVLEREVFERGEEIKLPAAFGHNRSGQAAQIHSTCLRPGDGQYPETLNVELLDMQALLAVMPIGAELSFESTVRRCRSIRFEEEVHA